ncbi:MAG: MerR family transcriptional regulator [Candidatus Limnocylindria bacterium]
MNIKRASTASGLEADTIRFYERAGVLPAPPRRPSGYRDYAEEHIATLQLVGGLRHLGLSLQAMQRVAAVAHEASCGDLRGALIAQLEEVSERTAARIGELERTREHVNGLLAGLRQMRPRAQRIPGAAPCRCIELVGEPAASAAARRRRSV